VAGGIWWVQTTRPLVRIPANIAEEVLFPTYLPRQLPEGYKLVPASFKIQDHVLLFDIRRDDGRLIHFAEEAKPKDFDFTAFYQQQMGKIRNLRGVPYPSVMGSLSNKGVMLSIVTDKTWLIIVSGLSSEDDLRAIAESLRRS
jgi:hypothetical protein